jgi:hypothetical protein
LARRRRRSRVQQPAKSIKKDQCSCHTVELVFRLRDQLSYHENSLSSCCLMVHKDSLVPS